MMVQSDRGEVGGGEGQEEPGGLGHSDLLSKSFLTSCTQYGAQWDVGRVEMRNLWHAGIKSFFQSHTAYKN